MTRENNCITHHYACACREEKFREIIELIKEIGKNMQLDQVPYGFYELIDLVEKFD